MTDKMDVYEELQEMYVNEDIVGGPKGESLLKVLRLYFSKSEASLALKIRFDGKKLDEIAEISGIKKDKLKKKLMAMADRGTIYYQVSNDDPVYTVVGTAAPGIVETGLWTNIKYPHSVALAVALNDYLKEWAVKKLSNLGAPFAPVWATPNALPDDAVPEENILEMIKDEGHWSVSPCPCRISHWITDPGNHCDHMLETCLHCGELSEWTIKHGMSRELTWDETVKFIEDVNKDGLVHTLNIQQCICNCCNDCCAIFHGHNQGNEVFVPSPFIPKIDEETCNSCSICAKRCPVDAIEVEKGVAASVNYDKCLGCGVCVPTCKTESIQLVRRA